MIKRLLPVLLLAFLIAACGGEAQTQDEVAAAPEAAQASEAEAAAGVEEPAPAADDVESDTVADGTEFVSECTIVSSLAESSSQYEELFALTDADWVIGPEDAAITIVEYGDFQ